jgi:hypothetical protein
MRIANKSYCGVALCAMPNRFGGEHEKKKTNVYRMRQKTFGLLHNMDKS